jgi:hypothetical protein
VRANGYTAAELDEAQQRFGLAFPPDLLDLFEGQRVFGERGYDWMRDHERIADALKWPLDGILFDVEEAGLWWPEWGERPATRDERAAIVADVVGKAPKLIPLMDHRYLPQEPNVAGNPIFSVYQSDIIMYGTDLANWMRKEIDPTFQAKAKSEVREIEFWSLTVERNGDPQFYRAQG